MRFLLIVAIICANVVATEPRGRVLLLGIDGCRYDAIEYSQAVHLKKLAKAGMYSDHTDVLGDRETGAATITGPGWCSALTGTWADKHGVRDNAFKNHQLAQFPTFMKRAKRAHPQCEVSVLVSWTPFQEHVFSAEEGCRLVSDGDRVGYAEADRQIANAAVRILETEDPTVLFAYFGEVDITGHGYGFHPRAPKYTNAIEAVDKQIGQILDVLKRRPNYTAENWLVIVCTDHGGQGRGHAFGRDVPEIRNGFLILWGDSVQPGKIQTRTFNVDVAVTALAHLGVTVSPEWKLDVRDLLSGDRQ